MKMEMTKEAKLTMDGGRCRDMMMMKMEMMMEMEMNTRWRCTLMIGCQGSEINHRNHGIINLLRGKGGARKSFSSSS